MTKCLHDACTDNNVDLVKKLLDQGTDQTRVNGGGLNALMIA